MTKRFAMSLAVLTLATAANAADQAPAPAPAAPEPAPVAEMQRAGPGLAVSSTIKTVTAVVTALDVPTRMITIKTSKGQELTFKVAPEVQRLNEIAVGDKIFMKYEQGLMLQVQPEGAKQEPSAVTAGADKAGAEHAPGGSAFVEVQGTVTVKTVNMKTRVVTVQGEQGRVYAVKAAPELKIEKLKPGSKLFAVYQESVAIDVEKAAKKPPAAKAAK